MIRQSCIATLAYFDLFQYPLTLVEVYRYLYWLGNVGDDELSVVTLDTVRDVLHDPAIGERDGYYFLKGSEPSVALRHSRYRLAQKKMRRAKWFAWCAARLRSVRLVAVCNNLAFCNARKESDIDLFIIVEPGALWTARFCITSVLTLFRLRPTRQKSADQLCASFWITSAAMDVSSLALPDGDPYLLFWIATLRPLYDAGGYADAFFAANMWVKKRLPFAWGAQSSHIAVLSQAPFFSFIERILRRFQERLLPARVRLLANRDSRVRVSNDILKFHTNDRRQHYATQFTQRLRKYHSA